MMNCCIRRILLLLLWLQLGGCFSSVPTSLTHQQRLSLRGGDSFLQKPSAELSHRNHRHHSLQASSSAEASDPDELLVPAIAVGAVTAFMGFVYGKILDASVHTLWKSIPARLGGAVHPMWFITGTFTLGGLLIGILAANISSSFTVADFVSILSNNDKEQEPSFPSTRSTLLPLLLLSLITSTIGFSVGPEAPMVCAGGLVGASMARNYFQKSPRQLAYAGAAGALTAFMGIPIAGTIFALELTTRSADMETTALSAAAAASIAALVVIRLLLLPSKAVGGHFVYEAAMATGASTILTGLGAGFGGAVLGTVFHRSVSALKGACWSKPQSQEKALPQPQWKRQVLVKTGIGLAVGLLSSYFPQTMFWGEGSLQSVIDGQKTAFLSTKHGHVLTGCALVNPNLVFSGYRAALQVSAAKFVAIALACAGKFPGGIIFPLFFAAAPLAAAASPLATMCLMAATQASVTRTPLATALMLTLSASATATPVSAMLPACLVASYSSIWMSRKLSSESYFEYSS